MPSVPGRPPEPSDLHQAFAATRPLDWGDNDLTAADIARLHGTDAASRSLWLLEQAAAIEPNVTEQFLASLPSTASPYQLARRVKSPESLARKIRDWIDTERRFPVDDVLRYTVLTESADDLVAAARSTVDELDSRGWRVKYAMHSYTDGSRYKGIHAYLTPPGIARAEVQFHSIPSVGVKEMTAPWYEIERSATASPDERASARRECIELSATLQQPSGIGGLRTLGGKRVAVNNYSDSREREQSPEHEPRGIAQQTHRFTAADRNDGIAR